MEFNILNLRNEENELIVTSKLFHKYYSYYNSKIKYQNQMATLSFYLILGCIAMKKGIFLNKTNEKLDLRTSIIWFSPSGTGKGMTLDLVHKILTQLNIQNTPISEPTPEAMVGSFDDITHERNIIKGYDITNPKYKNPKIEGYFEKNYFISLDEAQWLFDGNKSSEKILKYLRKVGDTYGSTSNLITSDTLKSITQNGLKYHSYSSFITACYLLDSLKLIILKNGIFQRVSTVFSLLDTNQIVDIIKNDNVLNEERQKKIAQQFIELVELFKLKLNSNVKEVRIIDTEVNKFFVEIFERFIRKIDDEILINQQEIRDFFIRSKNIILKYAGLNAFLNEREIINKDDIIMAVEIVFNNLETIIKFLITHSKEREIEILKLMRIILNPDEKYTKTQLRDKLCKSARWDGIAGMTKTLDIINQMEDYFIISKDPNTPTGILYKLKNIK
jgi:hypothetical protein